jgi:tripartite-type tricarboxylate transporter receptor subunit TctC
VADRISANRASEEAWRNPFPGATQERLGQPVVIENRSGAGGTLGAALVAKATPDGYTLLLVPTSHVINPSIYAKLPYDTERDFAPITMVASAAILMAVHPATKLPQKSPRVPNLGTEPQARNVASKPPT